MDRCPFPRIHTSNTSGCSTKPGSSTRWPRLPSRYESLSRTALEAWGLARPVLANAESDVLKGQCLRSNGGLCYRNAEEFVGMLQAFEQNRWLSGSLGKSGRQYFRDHYDWRVVERKYHDML